MTLWPFSRRAVVAERQAADLRAAARAVLRTLAWRRETWSDGHALSPIETAAVNRLADVIEQQTPKESPCQKT